jgi:regulator of sigma E protease
MMAGAFLLLLGPLVVLHELGHYLVARLFGVRAESFSIGLGKELFGWTDRRGTRWKLAAVPLGGYVLFAGDANPASMPDPALANASPEELEGTLTGAKLWQRALIVVAGPAANFVAAILIFAAFFMVYGQPIAPPVIERFAPDSAAQAAGLKLGDRIVAIDGDRIERFEDIAREVSLYPGRTISVAALRNGVEFVVPVRIGELTERDKFGNTAMRGVVGIYSPHYRLERVGPVRAVVLGAGQCVDVMHMMVAGLGQIFTGERSVKELGGPIRIAKFSGEQLTLGWGAFAWFAGLISINLAFINLLPIPTLDGGHLVFYAAEALRRKPVSLRSQEWAFRTGLALLLAFMLFATLNDLVSLRLFRG